MSNLPVYPSSAPVHALLGLNGGVVLTDGTSAVSLYYALTAITDVTISTMDLTSDWTGSMDGVTLPAGFTAILKFKMVQITGTALLYRNR